MREQGRDVHCVRQVERLSVEQDSHRMLRVIGRVRGRLRGRARCPAGGRWLSSEPFAGVVQW
jgi:hypothetical protein